MKRTDVSIIHERMPAGTSEVRHYHEKSRQFFFALSGVATLEMEGEVFHLSPHEGVEVAPGVPHQMRNESDEEVEFLVFSHPTTRGDRVNLESSARKTDCSRK